MVQVDAVALGIPDYHDIVRQPADLGTIRARLARGAAEVCTSITLVPGRPALTWCKYTRGERQRVSRSFRSMLGKRFAKCQASGCTTRGAYAQNPAHALHCTTLCSPGWLLGGTNRVFSQGWEASGYLEPQDVLDEVSRVWANCRLYNPAGEPILYAHALCPLQSQSGFAQRLSLYNSMHDLEHVLSLLGREWWNAFLGARCLQLTF